MNPFCTLLSAGWVHTTHYTPIHMSAPNRRLSALGMFFSCCLMFGLSVVWRHISVLSSDCTSSAVRWNCSSPSRHQMATSWQGCRSARYQPYSGGAAAVTRYNSYKHMNPFQWSRQESSQRTWWGPSVFGPPWWAFLPNRSFPCCLVALVRTTNASIGIFRHFVGFLARCNQNDDQPLPDAVYAEQPASGTAGKKPCTFDSHDHRNEVWQMRATQTVSVISDFTMIGRCCEM